MMVFGAGTSTYAAESERSRLQPFDRGRHHHRGAFKVGCRAEPTGGSLCLDLGGVFRTAQSEGRSDRVTCGQRLRVTEASIGLDWPQFGMDAQEEAPVGAAGIWGAVHDLDHQGGLLAGDIQMP